ncbi:MAG: pectinesterase family protein, partial [Deltaproteobacteria bacterium]|nr:pectinesterase family protein [Deltaproteobacteria bacterium]
EALYVGGLTVNSGTTLYLNGLNLYTHVVVGETSYVVQVYPGSGFSFGGGTIVSIPAGTYHVDIQSGSDTNDGSAASPWKTLHHAIAQISGGESGDYVLYVASGTYSVLNGEADEPLRLQQENVTIVGSGATPPVIDGTGAENWSTGLEMTGENLILQDLSVTDFSGEDEEGIRVTEGLNCQIHTCRVYGNNSGIRVSFSSNTLVSDCDIYQNSTHGIDLIWGADNDVIDNRIHDNPMYGVRVESGGESIPEISRNLIYDNDYGILVEAVNENTASPIIQNNVIYQVTTGAMSYGIFTSANNYGDANPEIYHNTIDGGTMSGIKMEVLGSGSSYPVIKYNTITNFEEYGIENSGAFPTVEYNDVWNNAVDNYSGVEVISTTNKSVDPLYVDPAHTDYSLQPGSECINAIPPAQEDPVGIDYPGYLRPRPGETDKDMGAYEYVADETVNYTLPTGTGLATDYRIFSIPLNLGTGADMLAAMVNVLGPYDNTTWRGFLYNGADYDEFNSGPFASHAIMPGMGYWIITTLTDTIPFTGKPAPDGVDYVMELAPGWHIIAPPWSYVTLYLDNFEVTDGIHTYPITSTLNDLTQQFLWDYTGNGAYSGYEMRGEGSLLQNDTGYFINVLSDKAVRLLISTGESNGYDVLFDTASSQVKTVQTDETPPPPPGSPPVADIKANGLDGPVSVAQGQPVTIKVTLDPEVWNGRNADWWVAAHTPFDPPGDWYTYVHPNGWRTGIHTCLQTPLFEVMSPFPVLNMVLPPGSYTFYFAVDGNMDGKPDATWLDAVQVTVE